MAELSGYLRSYADSYAGKKRPLGYRPRRYRKFKIRKRRSR